MIIRCNTDRSGGGAGFSLVELLIAITIFTVMASFITLNPNMLRPTAKSEAMKLAAYIHKAMQRSDRIHDGFTIKFGNSKGIKELQIAWDKKGSTNRKDMGIYPEPQGFSLTSNSTNNLHYSPKTNTFTSNGRTFTLTRNSDNSFYCIIFYQNGGRIRVSPTDDE